ncbi:MAG: undecaprenyl-diphosphate phosphatase [Rikenellaceae bacterium]|jgi:undecaprenyl-diphosphatase|nr:undecaprenyl-diphosphate phosphatase [Rikenellaceae bacterium]
MEVWESAIMGVVQGLTEFLPVSSSGHLAIMQRLFGVEGGNMSFDVTVHLATALASIVVFRREIGAIIAGAFRFQLNPQTVYLINIAVSMLPVIFVGLMLGEQIETLFDGSLILVGAMLIVTAGLLALSGYVRAGVNPITPKRAFVVGLAQAVAVLPGLSRSGTTIVAGLLQGVRREEMARFSFMMVIIPILGMAALDMTKSEFVFERHDLAGFATAFFTGLFACKAMVRLVSRGKLVWFAIYCAAAGLLALLLEIFM